MNERTFTASIAAGFAIGLGNIIYLAISPTSKIIAAFLFAIGLCAIRIYGLSLYTGSIQRWVWEKDFKFITLLPILAGNCVGILYSELLIGQFVHESLVAAATTKFIETGWFEILCGSLGCGMLMALATMKKSPIWLTIMCVAAFLLCGMRHSIADFEYLLVIWTKGGNFWKTTGKWLIEIGGNFLGGVIMAVACKVGKINEENSSYFLGLVKKMD